MHSSHRPYMDSNLVGHMSSKENIIDMMALSKAEGQIGWERYVHLWALGGPLIEENFRQRDQG